MLSLYTRRISFYLVNDQKITVLTQHCWKNVYRISVKWWFINQKSCKNKLFTKFPTLPTKNQIQILRGRCNKTKSENCNSLKVTSERFWQADCHLNALRVIFQEMLVLEDNKDNTFSLKNMEKNLSRPSSKISDSFKVFS